MNNIIERAVSFSGDGKIHGKDLQFVFNEMDSGEEATVRMNLVDLDRPFKEVKQQIVENFEKEYLQELLAKNKGNVSKAAREAKIDRKHLRNLLIKYGILTSVGDREDDEEG